MTVYLRIGETPSRPQNQKNDTVDKLEFQKKIERMFGPKPEKSRFGFPVFGGACYSFHQDGVTHCRYDFSAWDEADYYEPEAK